MILREASTWQCVKHNVAFLVYFLSPQARQTASDWCNSNFAFYVSHRAQKDLPQTSTNQKVLGFQKSIPSTLSDTEYRIARYSLILLPFHRIAVLSRPHRRSRVSASLSLLVSLPTSWKLIETVSRSSAETSRMLKCHWAIMRSIRQTDFVGANRRYEANVFHYNPTITLTDPTLGVYGVGCDNGQRVDRDVSIDRF